MAERTRVEALEREYRQVETELGRLTHAVAQGGELPSILAAIREREKRLASLERALTDRRRHAPEGLRLDVVLPEIRHRLQNWQQMLLEESGQARQMLRRLLRGRLVFTPQLEAKAVRFTGEGDLSGIFEGLVDSQALASPPGTARKCAVRPGSNRRDFRRHNAVEWR